MSKKIVVALSDEMYNKIVEATTKSGASVQDFLRYLIVRELGGN